MELEPNKQVFLDTVSDAAQLNTVTLDEVVGAYKKGAALRPGASLTKPLNIAEIFYYIGAFIIVLGIVISVGENWDNLNNISKLLITLGSGIASFYLGVLFGRNPRFNRVGIAFHVIAGLVLPLGLFVLLNGLGVPIDGNLAQIEVTAALSAIYSAAYVVIKEEILLPFLITYLSWFFFAFTNLLLDNGSPFDESTLHFYLYRFLVLGLSYLLLGNYFSRNRHKGLSTVLYILGTCLFLGTSLGLGGPDQSGGAVWELLYPAFIFGILYASVQLKVKSFLVLGSLFLMFYILKITAEYFTSGLGWPLALVIAGLSLIGVGYYSVYLNKRFISK